MAITEKVFSEVEVRKIGIKIEGATKADVCECVGGAEEEMDVKIMTKKCRGVTSKTRTKGTGTGNVKLSLHMPQDLFASLYGMEDEKLLDGVIAYGENSLHPVFCMTEEVLDEDDNVKYKAYPKCSIQKGFSRSVENGGEEVKEVEVEIAVMPDKYGYGLYEAIAEDLTETGATEKWMEEFTPDLVRKDTSPA